MSEVHTYPVPEEFAANAHITLEKYQAMYKRSIEQPEEFWAEQAKEFLTWDKEWNSVKEFDFYKGEANWFDGGKLNVSVNCIDRHLETRGEQTAIIWESDDPAIDLSITYNDLYDKVCRLANVLRERGVKKGERVCRPDAFAKHRAENNGLCDHGETLAAAIRGFNYVGMLREPVWLARYWVSPPQICHI